MANNSGNPAIAAVHGRGTRVDPGRAGLEELRVGRVQRHDRRGDVCGVSNSYAGLLLPRSHTTADGVGTGRAACDHGQASRAYGAGIAGLAGSIGPEVGAAVG